MAVLAVFAILAVLAVSAVLAVLVILAVLSADMRGTNFCTFRILNGNAKSNSKHMGLWMGLKNLVPNTTWERMDKRVMGKS